MGAEEYEEDASERASMCCVYNELISGYVSRRCHVQWSTNGVSSWQPVTCSVTSASFSLASFVVARRCLSVCLSVVGWTSSSRSQTTNDDCRPDLIIRVHVQYICLAQITRAARNQRAHLIISCFGIPPSLLYFQPNSFTCVTMSMYTQKQSV